MSIQPSSCAWFVGIPNTCDLIYCDQRHVRRRTVYARACMVDHTYLELLRRCSSLTTTSTSLGHTMHTQLMFPTQVLRKGRLEVVLDPHTSLFEIMVPCRSFTAVRQQSMIDIFTALLALYRVLCTPPTRIREELWALFLACSRFTISQRYTSYFFIV